MENTGEQPNYRTQCEEIARKLNGEDVRSVLEDLVRAWQEKKTAYEERREEMQQSVAGNERRAKQIESEIEQLNTQLGRLGEQYSKRHGERLKLAKRIIENEQKNEEVEAQNARLERKISECEARIRRVSQPSGEVLFREIMRGFGIEFVERGKNRLIAKVKHKVRKDIVEIDTTGRDMHEVSEEIWKALL